MRNKELHEYFDNLDKHSLLDIKKTIIELTNNYDLELLIQLKIELYQYYNTHINKSIKNAVKAFSIDFKNNTTSFNNTFESDFFDNKLKSVSYDEIVKNNESFIAFYPKEINLFSSPNLDNLNIDLTDNESINFLGFNDKLEHLVERLLISLDKENSLLIELLQIHQHLFFIENLISSKEIISALIKLDFKKETYIFLLELTNKIIDITQNKITISQNNNPIEESETSLDGTTIGTKILFLHKLGVIDFLRKSEPFNMSINKLSAVLSAITDANINSIQPVLNPLISDKEIVNKNNPYYNPKNVQKVEQTLINLGYKLDK